MRNPINNLITPIAKQNLKSCNRCGCPDLAWVKYKSGKWGLVQTATERPFSQGDSEAPKGLWAVKTAYHNCNEYQEKQAAWATELAKYQIEYDDRQLRATWCHPKADKPYEILTDAFIYLYTNNINEFTDCNSSIRRASEILGVALGKVKEKE